MQKAGWKIVSVKALVNSTPRAYPADSRTCGPKSHEILIGAVKVDQLQLYRKMCASHLKLSEKKPDRSQTEDYIPYDSVCKIQNHTKLIYADISQDSGWGGEPMGGDWGNPREHSGVGERLSVFTYFTYIHTWVWMNAKIQQVCR